jgi:hypothetical protein
MGPILDNPFAPAVLACAVVAALLGAAQCFTKLTWIGEIAAPLIFLTAYFQTYQKVPAFPPVGAANKVFYVGLVAAIVIFAVERLPTGWLPAMAKAIFASLLGVIWIGYAQFAHPDFGLFSTAAAIVVVGAVVLWRIERLGSDPTSTGSASALATLAAVSALLAPVALFGGSSTSVGMCLGVTVGLAILSVAYLIVPLPVRATAIFGLGAGMLAVVEPIALISRKADLLALAVIALAPFLAALGVRWLPDTARRSPTLVWFVSGLAALSPLVVIVALLFLRHESPI